MPGLRAVRRAPDECHIPTGAGSMRPRDHLTDCRGGHPPRRILGYKRLLNRRRLHTLSLQLKDARIPIGLARGRPRFATLVATSIGTELRMPTCRPRELPLARPALMATMISPLRRPVALQGAETGTGAAGRDDEHRPALLTLATERRAHLAPGPLVARHRAVLLASGRSRSRYRLGLPTSLAGDGGHAPVASPAAIAATVGDRRKCGIEVLAATGTDELHRPPSPQSLVLRQTVEPCPFRHAVAVDLEPLVADRAGHLDPPALCQAIALGRAVHPRLAGALRLVRLLTPSAHRRGRNAGAPACSVIAGPRAVLPATLPKVGQEGTERRRADRTGSLPRLPARLVMTRRRAVLALLPGQCATTRARPWRRIRANGRSSAHTVSIAEKCDT